MDYCTIICIKKKKKTGASISLNFLYDMGEALGKRFQLQSKLKPEDISSFGVNLIG